MGGKGQVPATVAAPPEPEPTPTREQVSEPAAKAVRDSESRELRNKRGAAGTILTNPLGLDANDTTLLG
jgi:hypothetical protein